MSPAKLQKDQCYPVLEKYEKGGTVYTGDRTKNKFSLFGGQSGLQVSAFYYMCSVREIHRNLDYRNTHMHKKHMYKGIQCSPVYNIDS